VRVLVLGGTRFLGQHIVRGLVSRGHCVCVFHRGKTERAPLAGVLHLHGDFATLPQRLDDIRGFEPDVLVDVVPFHDKGGHGFAHFEAIVERAVVVTSGDVYRAFARLAGSEPGPPDPVPLTEESPLRTKPSPDLTADVAFDNVEVERAASCSRMPVTVIRAPVIFGPDDPYRRLRPHIQRMDDRRPAIVVDARLARWRWSRGYVENVAAAVVLAATNPVAAGRTYNVAPVETLTETEWIRAIGQACGWEGAIIAAPAEALPKSLRAGIDAAQDIVLDSTRIRSELGYAEPIALTDALRETVAWERANPPAPSPQVDYAAEDAAIAKVKWSGASTPLS
jgi:nucleoside-diphosphate-sugar epimerase